MSRVGVAAAVGLDPLVRRREPELMDDEGLARGPHLEALDALERVNRLSLTAARAWREIERIAREGRAPVRVLDVACGGGDVLIDLARRAGRRGVSVELLGCDASPVALERAAARAGRAASPGPTAAPVRFEQQDVLSSALPSGTHVVLCSLFLHHLADDEAARLLRSMADACDDVLLVQDLLRTRMGYVLAWLGLHALTRSWVARRDGLVSVRAAFSLAEARDLAREAGLDGATVRRCWPQRFLLRWQRRGDRRGDRLA